MALFSRALQSCESIMYTFYGVECLELSDSIVTQRNRLPMVSSYVCLLLCPTREIGILVWWWEIRRLPAVERGMHHFTLHKKLSAESQLSI